MEELYGSAKWSLDAGQNLTINREVIVPWLNHATWAASQIGTADLSFTQCRCRRAALIEPLGPMSIAGGAATYTHAKVGLTYIAEAGAAEWPNTGGAGNETPTFPQGCSVKIQVRGSGEFLLVPPRDLRWADNVAGSGALPIPAQDSGVNKLVIPQEDWSITLGNLAVPPFARLRAMAGTVNNATFLGYPAETLLFESWDYDRQWSLDNGQAKIEYSVTWHLKGRLITRGANQMFGWNHEYRADGWTRVKMANGEDRYIKTDFKTLFT